jgi:hypothetical protein
MAILRASSIQHQSDGFELYVQGKHIDRLYASHNATLQTTVMACAKIKYRQEFLVTAIYKI